MAEKPLAAAETGWLSASQITETAFRECLKDEAFKKSFQESHWESLCERAGALFKISQKLSIFNLVMGFALFASKTKTPLELSVAGVALKSVADLQEPILMALSLGLVLQAVVSYAYMHLETLINTFVGATNTPRQAVFIRPIYTFYKSWIPALERDVAKVDEKSLFVTGWLVLLGSVFTLFVLFTGIFLELAVLYITAVSGIELLSRESSRDHGLEWIMGSVALGAVAVRVMIAFVQLPFPYKHYPNIGKLNELASSNPREHERQLLLSSEIDNRNRMTFKRWAGSALGILIAVAAPAVISEDRSLLTFRSLTLTFACILVVGFLGAYASERLRMLATARFFKASPPDTKADNNDRARRFARLRKTQNKIWMIICVVLSIAVLILYSFFDNFIFTQMWRT